MPFTLPLDRRYLRAHRRCCQVTIGRIRSAPRLIVAQWRFIAQRDFVSVDASRQLHHSPEHIISVIWLAFAIWLDAIKNLLLGRIFYRLHKPHADTTTRVVCVEEQRLEKLDWVIDRNFIVLHSIFIVCIKPVEHTCTTGTTVKRSPHHLTLTYVFAFP